MAQEPNAATRRSPSPCGAAQKHAHHEWSRRIDSGPRRALAGPWPTPIGLATCLVVLGCQQSPTPSGAASTGPAPLESSDASGGGATRAAPTLPSASRATASPRPIPEGATRFGEGWGFSLDIAKPLTVNPPLRAEDFSVFWIMDGKTQVLGMYLGGYPQFDRHAPSARVGQAEGQCETKPGARSCLFAVHNRNGKFAPQLHVWTSSSDPAVLAQADAILATLHVE